MNAMEPIFLKDSCYCGIDLEVYPLPVILKTAYLFLNRCYMFLYHDTDGTLRVRLKSKSAQESDLGTLANEFLNELLNQSVRFQISRETKNLRELIMARALHTQCIQLPSTSGQTNQDDFASDQDSLGIRRDWFEEFQGKDKPQ
jgi:His-Xaa-Ser system protein HxsD